MATNAERLEESRHETVPAVPVPPGEEAVPVPVFKVFGAKIQTVKVRGKTLVEITVKGVWDGGRQDRRLTQKLRMLPELANELGEAAIWHAESAK